MFIVVCNMWSALKSRNVFLKISTWNTIFFTEKEILQAHMRQTTRQTDIIKNTFYESGRNKTNIQTKKCMSLFTHVI